MSVNLCKKTEIIYIKTADYEKNNSCAFGTKNTVVK